MNVFKSVLGIVGLIILLIISSSMFTIIEGERGILLRLGRIVISDAKTIQVFKPGLHFKLPLIDTIRIFDTRIQTLDIKSSRIVTKEKKDVIVDYYVKWRIEDISRYFTSTSGHQHNAETLLEQQLNTALRAEFGKRTISNVLLGGRENVMEVLREKAERQARQLGIFVVDVRIKGIELPENTSNAIYQRMRADMQIIANRHRADGRAGAERIRAEADAAVTVAIATAQSEGQTIRASGEAKAAEIYTQAFQRNPEFFSFYRSLKAYEQSFQSKQDILLLDQSTAFFQYFKNGPKK